MNSLLLHLYIDPFCLVSVEEMLNGILHIYVNYGETTKPLFAIRVTRQCGVHTTRTRKRSTPEQNQERRAATIYNRFQHLRGC